MNQTTRNTNSRIPPPSTSSKLKSLKWWTPIFWLPHGASGIVSVGIGMYICSHGLLGHIDSYMPTSTSFSSSSWSSLVPFTFVFYAVSTTINAIAGFLLAKKAKKNIQGIFRRSAIVQVCLCYYVLRFAPHASIAYHQILNTGGSVIGTATGNGGIPFMTTLTWLVDTVMAGILNLCIVSFFQVAHEAWWSSSKEMSIGLAIGTICLLSVGAYPAQLSIFGQDWYDRLQERYPYQALCFVIYVYVPATVTFSLMLFNATLLERGVVNVRGWGMILALAAPLCLIVMVFCMEYYFFNVSTQRIYVPDCEPDPQSLSAQIDYALDFSRYSRQVMTVAFGWNFPEDNTQWKSR
jgi:hypothetical protein